MHPEVEKLQEVAALNCKGEKDAPRLADLLDTIEQMISKYVLLPAPGLATLVAAWIAGTYCFELFHFYGYLALRSATPRCGKTRLLRLTALLANGAPPITISPTAAVLFRSTRKVLILDEVDRLRNADKESFGDVLAVLNSGFERGGTVERVEKAKGGAWEVKEFQTYGPKAFAGIESLADALADRAFMVKMERTPDRMPRLNVRHLQDTATEIRQDFELWAALHESDVLHAYDDLPDELDNLRDFDDRFQDIAEPLVILAILADAERPAGSAVLPRLLEGFRVAAGRREASSRERQLVAFLDLADELLTLERERFVPSEELVAACGKIEDLSTIESARRLKGFLAHFDLRPSSNGKQRGYHLSTEWVDTWRARYGEQV